MSASPQLPQNFVLVPMSGTNSLGVAGFVVSLVGLLLTGGLLCPVGLVLSLVALSRPPRGFAIAGVVLGLVGTCGGLLLVLAIGAAILAAVGIGVAAAFVTLADPDRAEITFEMASIAEAVQSRQHRDGVPPAAITTLGLDEQTLIDPWHHPYRYLLTDRRPGFDIISDGPDGQPATDDDIALSRFDDYWDQFFDVQEDKDTRTVRLKVGHRTIVLRGDERGGKVEIDLGDRTIHMSGRARGGEITVERHEPTTTAPGDALPADAPPAPDQPPAPPEPPAPGGAPHG